MFPATPYWWFLSFLTPSNKPTGYMYRACNNLAGWSKEDKAVVASSM
jgi:hypothetical protein